MLTTDARQAIATFTPDFEVQTIRTLGSGTDSAAFIVNDKWVCRFPLRPAAQHMLQKEIALLGSLQQQLSISIPHFEEVARDGERLVYARYRALPGIPLSRQAFAAMSRDAQQHIQAQLAHFLQELHAFPVESAAAAGVQKELFKGAFHAAQAQLLTACAPVLSAPEVDRIGMLISRYTDRQADSRVALLHADLKPEHILYDPATGRLSGIIDWGDICLGERGYDFTCFYLFYGPEFVARLLAVMPEDYRRTKASLPFYILIRWLQDVAIELAEGDGDSTATYLAALRSHLKKMD